MSAAAMRSPLPTQIGEAIARELVRLFFDDATPIRERIGLGKRLLAHVPPNSWQRLTAPESECPDADERSPRNAATDDQSPTDRRDSPAPASVSATPNQCGDPHPPQSVSPHTASDVATPIRRDGPRISRNALCLCGSGQKSKRCCGRH